jgi:predicted dehydrogenase
MNAKKGSSMNVALVGCGAVSEILYVKALKRLEQEGLLTTVAAVDPNVDRTAIVGATLTGARQYATLDAALSGGHLDLAIIAAPHRFHADQAIACLNAGAAVLCEKPMAMTTAECDRMIAAADQSNRLLAVGHFRRFFPSCQIIKTMIATGALGAVKSFRVLEGETYSWPAQSASFFNRQEAGGGVLIDAGAHTIDLLLWWLGDVAQLEYQDDAMGGIETNSVLRLKMANGAAGTVHLSRDWPLPNRYRIDCEHGWVTYICDEVDRIEWGFHQPGHPLETRMADAPSFMDCFVLQLRNVVAAIGGQEPLAVPGREARKTVALIEECYRSRKLLEMPWLEPAERVRAERLAHV